MPVIPEGMEPEGVTVGGVRYGKIPVTKPEKGAELSYVDKNKIWGEVNTMFAEDEDAKKSAPGRKWWGGKAKAIELNFPNLQSIYNYIASKGGSPQDPYFKKMLDYYAKELGGGS